VRKEQERIEQEKERERLLLAFRIKAGATVCSILVQAVTSRYIAH
jgi:hypothetical protein